MDRPSSSLPKLAMLGLPLLLGLTGFLLSGESFLNGLFSSIALYTMNYQDVPPNLWVEAGRWTAPLATASGVLFAVSALRERIRARLRYRRGDSVAVYGPEAEKAPLLARLGGRGIDGGSRFIRARQYILLGGEGLDFYAQYRGRLGKSEVYLQSGSLRVQSAPDSRLRLFCPEETAARLFWKRQKLYDPLQMGAGQKLRLDIVFIGFGRLGEELLTCGLQGNIFAPDQRITYHIFGAEDKFAAIHTQLGEISDPVLFYDGPWYASLPLLEDAGMILVLQQDGQAALLQDLLLATCRPRLHVFATGDTDGGLLASQERLEVFPWRQEAQSPEHILSDILYQRAKRINLRYAHIYGGVEENDRTMEEQWACLDAFTRYSNISAADYHEMRLAMLEAMGEAADGSSLSPERLELLSELEHIRWCRYHYLNNWRAGVPENGKRKDARLRIHADLVPYGELTDGEKEKDRENIRILLSVKL